MKLINKIFFYLCNFYNSKYYNYSNVSNRAIFSPEFPGFVTLINPNNISIGDFTVLNRGTHINAGKANVKIGKYCHFGKKLTIYAFNHNYNSKSKIPYDNVNIYRDVEIKDFVWIGANVNILPGITIGEGAIVGAGAVVSKDVPDCAIVAGNPSKIIKYRDKEQFYKLKKQKKFY